MALSSIVRMPEIANTTGDNAAKGISQKEFTKLYLEVYGNPAQVAPVWLPAKGGTVSGNLAVTGDITSGGKSVLKVGDIPTGQMKLPVLEDFKTLKNPTGVYTAYGAGAPNLATPNAPPASGNSRLTVTVNNDGSVTHYTVIENTGSGGIVYVGVCYGLTTNLIWRTVLTDGNASKFAITPDNIQPYLDSVKPKAVADGLGYDQKWKKFAVGAGRTWTNTTGKPAELVVYGSDTSAKMVSLIVDGITVGGNIGTTASASAVVPVGSTCSYTSVFLNQTAYILTA